MDYLSPLLFGLLLAVVGIDLPGTVNMTAVSVSIKRGMRAGLYYSAGAAATIILQAYIAVAFAGYLSQHPEIFTYIRAVSVAIFLALAFFFFYQALNAKAVKASQRKGRPFLLGMAVAVAIWAGLGQVFPDDPLWLALPLRLLRYALLTLWVTYYAPWVFVKIRLAKATPDPGINLSLS